MILPINKVKQKDKSFFIECVQVYIKLVEAFCKKHSIQLNTNSEHPPIELLRETGFISGINDIAELKFKLGDLYERFITAVNFVQDNKSSIGTLVDNLNNSARKKLQSSRNCNSLTLVDFFCGAGGLSLGFRQEGFNIVLANDIEDVCIQTYKYNHPEIPSSRIIQGDIKEIVDNIDEYLDSEVDIVVGGPPCQGFSEANRQRVIDDPRNFLYKYFVEAVSKIKPKFVVMENVKGMLKVADQVVEDYANIKVQVNDETVSYKVCYRILNSADYNVAQSRERLIYIAIRSDICKSKDVTPELIFELLEKSKSHKKYILQQALEYIRPLDAPRIKNQNEIDSEECGMKIDVNTYSNTNEYLELINQGRTIEYVFNHKARYCSDTNYEIYKRLNQGDDATDEKIVDIMPYAHRNHCFKDKYYKLYADRPCRTITAHLRMDCHSHIHPTQIRSLTPREAARVQSFPDDYLFFGPYLKTYMQVGNAVPPLLARAIAKTIKTFLKED